MKEAITLVLAVIWCLAHEHFGRTDALLRWDLTLHLKAEGQSPKLHCKSFMVIITKAAETMGRIVTKAKGGIP